MGGHPSSNKAHTAKKLESGQTWHLGQFRHAGFRTEIGILIPVAVYALGTLSAGAPPIDTMNKGTESRREAKGEAPSVAPKGIPKILSLPLSRVAQRLLSSR